MFLSSLNIEEKKNFLELADHIIKCDEKANAEETETFDSYKHECDLIDYEIRDKSFNDVINEMKGLKKEKLRIIILELMLIILSDDNYVQEEKDHMDRIAKAWDFTESQMRRFERWARDFIDVVEDGYKLITPKK